MQAHQLIIKLFFVAKPGTLVSMLTEDEANSVTHLTLTGKLNAIDFKHLRDEFKNLKVTGYLQRIHQYIRR